MSRATAVAAAALLACAFEPGAAAPHSPSALDVVERFLANEDHALTSYRAVRTLEAATRGGQMRARLVASTSLDPVDGFTYSIVEESGSAVIRQRVLRAALEAERSMRERGELARAALTEANYDFGVADAEGDDLVRVAIHPRRHDTLLVDGSVVLSTAAADLVRVEGRLSKRPSFWTRRVEIARRYARKAGVRVPVSTTSTADVLLVGRSTFSMTYEYASVNGQALSVFESAAAQR